MFKTYVKLVVIRKVHLKEQGIFEGTTYVLLNNGIWKEVHKYHWGDTRKAPEWYASNLIFELEHDDYILDDVLVTIKQTLMSK